MTDVVGKRLVGRAAGIPLNEQGTCEAIALAARLRARAIEAVYSSPLERAVATARAVAEGRHLEVQVRDGLTDIDFGEWTGKTIAELQGDGRFQRFNTHRTGTRPPGGEHVVEVQHRMVWELEQLAARHPDGTVMVVSHADPIRAALGFFLGFPMDSLTRIEIGTGSCSCLVLTPDAARLLSLNEGPFQT